MEAEEIDNKLLELQDLYSVGKIQLFELVNRCFLLGKQHVTAEKDKEIGILRKIIVNDNDEIKRLSKELQQIKEENERMSLSKEEIQNFVNKLKTFNRSPDYIQGYQNGLHAANHVIISKKISKPPINRLKKTSSKIHDPSYELVETSPIGLHFKHKETGQDHWE